ncbi:hypothetical protein XELAEV_18004731mg, partial [Xenopus laevis]
FLQRPSYRKEKVIVVIDDLTDPDPELKNKILQQQPSIGALAAQLFLFHSEEKNYQALTSDEFMENKMKEQKDIIMKKRKKKSPNHSSGTR